MPVKIPVSGAGKPGGDFIELPTADEAYEAALIREREGYARYGRDAEAAEVDVELARHRAAMAGEVVFNAPERGPEVVVQLLATRPVSTEPGCEHPECVLTHPHAGPAILTADGAREAGLVFDRKAGTWRPPRNA